MRFARTFAALLCVLIVSFAQVQTSVQVDGQKCFVTDMGNHKMFQIAGPAGAAMVTVDKGKITAILSPPGGVLNGVDYGPLVHQVWDAYLAQKSSGQQASPAPPDDPNAALRAQAAAITAQAQARAAGTAAGAPQSVEFPSNGGAIVHGTPFGDITFNADGTEASAIQKSSNSLAGATSRTLSYEFVGEKNSAGAVAKGVGGAVLGAMNVRHTGRVDKGGIEVYSQAGHSKKERVYGTEDTTFAVNPAVGNPLDHGVREIAKNFLDAAKDAGVYADQEAQKQGSGFRMDTAVKAEFDKYAANPKQ